MGAERDVEASGAKVFIRSAAGTGVELKTMEQIMQDGFNEPFVYAW